jgi:GDP-L-fucose synthase
VERAATIYVAGAGTFIGSAIVHALRGQGYDRLAGADGDEPNLTDAGAVDRFFRAHRPSYVLVAAGRILGIGGNQRRPADLMLDNLLVQSHVIASAHRHGVEKLLYLASGCAYPRLCPQPMRPEALLSGPLEPTSEFYATAKLAGLKLCEAYRRQYGADFVTGIPANPFGAGDDFDPEDAHVIGALMRRMHEAKERDAGEVEIWGTGTARREFIFVDDLADACLFVMREYDGPAPINLAGGGELSIGELAEIVRDVVGYRGRLRFDASKPDGMPRKVFDGSALAALGWRPRTPFRAALAATYEWFVNTQAAGGMAHAR